MNICVVKFYNLDIIEQYYSLTLYALVTKHLDTMTIISGMLK